MAAARSYRDDLQCPHCGSPKTDTPRQANLPCRLCHYRFTPDGNRHYYPAQVSEQAIDLYGEGMGHSRHQPGFGSQAGQDVHVGQKSRCALGIWVR